MLMIQCLIFQTSRVSNIFALLNSAISISLLAIRQQKVSYIGKQNTQPRVFLLGGDFHKTEKQLKSIKLRQRK
jgi:hypothetical protein